MWKSQLRSVNQTMAMARRLAEHVRPGDLIALEGELGAGKTQFVRGLAVGMGIDPLAVASPTFVLVHEYTAREGDVPLVHIDAYRLSTLADLESIGWDRPMPEMRRQAVVAIEWADRLGEEIGEDYLRIELEHAGQEQRDLTVTPHGSWVERFELVRESLEATVRETGQQSPEGVQSAATPVRPCPICGKAVSADASTFPFCSARCRTIDLGKWASGAYTISRPIEQSDLEEGE